jgi:SAM-dependent methyltransferase
MNGAERPTAIDSPRIITTDAEFDLLLPQAERQASARYWTPVTVARRVAQLLSELGVRRVLDVGSGPGKLCLVGASCAPDAEFVGVEQRPHLVAIAERLARELGTPNATFCPGDATRMSWSDFDAVYVFNSFAENIFSTVDRFDDTVELSRGRYVADVLLVARKLAELSEGTLLLTYHGLGGPIPDAYTRLHVESAGTGWLHVWRHDGCATGEMFWLEDDDDIHAVRPAELRRLLRSVQHGGATTMIMHREP